MLIGKGCKGLAPLLEYLKRFLNFGLKNQCILPLSLSKGIRTVWRGPLAFPRLGFELWLQASIEKHKVIINSWHGIRKPKPLLHQTRRLCRRQSVYESLWNNRAGNRVFIRELFKNDVNFGLKNKRNPYCVSRCQLFAYIHISPRTKVLTSFLNVLLGFVHKPPKSSTCHNLAKSPRPQKWWRHLWTTSYVEGYSASMNSHT